MPSLMCNIKTHPSYPSLLPLHRQLFCEPSPAPTKWALQQLGHCNATVRLPLVELTEAGQASVAAALRDSGLR